MPEIAIDALVKMIWPHEPNNGGDICPLSLTEQCLTGRISTWCQYCRTLEEILCHPNLVLPKEFAESLNDSENLLKNYLDEKPLFELFKHVVEVLLQDLKDNEVDGLDQNQKKLLLALKLLQEQIQSELISYKDMIV